MKPGVLLPLLLLSFSLPDPVGQLVMAWAITVPFIHLRRDTSTVPPDGAHLAAWVYENAAGHRERRSVLERLSGIELAALLEASSQLHVAPHRAPATLPSEAGEQLIVNELRRHNIQDLKEARDRETVSRFVRAVESDSPALPPAEHALTEATKLASNHPDAVVQVLRDWLLQPDSLERFRVAMEKAPAHTTRLIQAYHLELDHPGLSPAEEVAVVLSLMKSELRTAYSCELPNLPKVTPTFSDREFVARRFVARVWSRISHSYISSTVN
jgi:hypothetical protein